MISTFQVSLYVLLGIIEVGAEYFEQKNLIVLLKPLIMLLIFVWVLLRRIEQKTNNFDYFLFGTVFAWLGDIFLLGTEDVYFMLGLGSFLLMQVFYIISFYQLSISPNIGLRLFYVGIWAVMNWLIRSGVEDLAIPVLLYSSVLCIMAFSAAEIKIKRPVDSPLLKAALQNSSFRLAAGSLLFLISDGLIALTKFGVVPASSLSQAAVMVTYIVAQGFIAHGYVAILTHEKRE